MDTKFLDADSANKLNGLMKGMASLTESGAYNEETFQYLLEGESKRVDRSGYFYQILLVYRTNAQGAIVQMDSEVAQIAIAAMSRCLRETDYVGWYRKGRIVGGVLTVLTQESMAQVSRYIQRRMAETLQSELSIAESRSFQIRAYQHHELEGVELREQF